MSRLSLEEALADATQDVDILGKNNTSNSSRSNATHSRPVRASMSSKRIDLSTPPPLKLASPAPIKAWSKDSVLTPIHSPDSNHPQSGISNLPQQDMTDQDEHLPSASLAATTDSVREFRTGTPIILSSGADAGTEFSLDDSNGQRGGSLRSSTPSKKKFLNVQDVYLNEFGERVVDGQVVGKTIGGRKRSVTPVSSESSSSTALNRNPETEKLLLSPSSRLMETHGQTTSRSSTPPAFFLQSFPDALLSPSPNSRPSSPLKSRATTPKKSPQVEQDESQEYLTPSNSLSRELQSQSLSPSPSPTSSRVASPSPGPSRRELSSPGPAPLDPGRSVASAATVTSTQSAPLILHGNHRQAKAAGVDPSQAASTSTLPSSASNILASQKSSSSTSRRRSKYADEGVTQAPFPLDDDDPIHEDSRSARRLASNANVIERTASLFFTPLVQGKQIGSSRVEPDRDRWEREEEEEPASFSCQSRGRRSGHASEPSSPIFRSTSVSSRDRIPTDFQEGTNEDQDDDAASLDSLLSLPVSIHTNSSHSPSVISVGSRGSDSPSSGRSRDLDFQEDSNDGNDQDDSNGMPSNSASVARRRSYRNEAGRSQGRKKKSDPDDLFARQVGIKGWNEVGERARGFIVFTVRITTKTVSKRIKMDLVCRFSLTVSFSSLYQGTIITILRRFSSFVDLRKALLAECPVSNLDELCE